MFKNDWDLILDKYIKSDEFNYTMKKVTEEYNKKICYPTFDKIFNSFKLTSYRDTKVVILGQDPYHEENQAHGLSFSVMKGTKLPPSLKNIYKELEQDLGIKKGDNGDLTSWANQGVLLLNSILTVEKNKPASHQNIGWEKFTDYVISKLNEKNTPIVFILWGNYAKSKKKLITNKNHYIIESNHPSPFSAYKGFFNSKPFSKTNDFLIKNKIKKINF